MRTVIVRVAVLGLGLGTAFGAIAQDHWQPTDRSMTDFLQEGYQLVSVTAPSPQFRIFFLSKPGMIAKCSEEAKLAPPPIAGGKPDFDPRGYAPAVGTKFECSRLAKSR
jgi:hypothetical protein